MLGGEGLLSASVVLIMLGDCWLVDGVDNIMF